MLPVDLLTKPLGLFANISPKKVAEDLQTNLTKGLSEQEVDYRLKLYGKNVIKEEIKLHIILQFLGNFKSPLVLILFIIALVSFFTGETLDGFLVLAMILMSVVLNFVQEYKAGRAAEALKSKIANTSAVIRNGVKKEIATEFLCVGDLVELNAGDLIPADCRVISCKDFFINQSSLTGESFPIEKYETEIDLQNPELTQLTNIIFHGTSVVTGSAIAIVLKIGSGTEFGKIAVNISGAEQDNEFTRGVTKFSLLILKVVIFFVLFIFLVNSLLKHNLLESLLFSVAVAVGLTPEFLPMIMSVTMAKGSISMAKKGVIVKKLSAIPTFGSLDVLCTDKTGTLTEDKIRLVKYIDLYGNHSEKVFLHAYLNSSFQTGITNPMDDAVVHFKTLEISKYKKIDEIPFDFNRKKMSVVIETPNKELTLITKGAPEEVMTCCTSFDDKGTSHKLDEGQINFLSRQYLALSNEGYRVLAIATKKVTTTKKVYEAVDESNLELLGYIAFFDPPKEGVKSAIEELEKMGVEVKILTGDNELVAKKICTEVGINIKGILLGHELHQMSDQTLRHVVNDKTIFARFSPDDKNRIIHALKENGHVVGYMGDGINDAPSLKSADVGISVSNAVDVAKESADIVLTQKSLYQLKDGVIEGRKTFGNTMKYIMMGISSNFGNMFSVLGAVIFLPFLPMLPIQILLNNFLYDFSQITIPTDNVDSDFIHKPKRWSIKYIRNFMFIFGPISSFFDFTTYFVMFALFSHIPSAFQTGWFMESLATQTLVIHIIRTRQIPFIQSKPSAPLLLSTIAVVILGWIIPATKIGGFFGFSPLPLGVIITLAVIVLAYLLTVETGKRLFFRKYFDLQ